MTKKKKKRRLRLKGPLGAIRFRDPMTVILTVLLVVMTLGTGLKGCLHGISGHVNICLDAAFGGDSKGYEGLVNEAEAAEKIVDELEALLEQDSRFTVTRTHKTGTSKTIAERVETAEKAKADLILSIQAPGSPDASKSGMTVYADEPSSSTNAKSLKAAQAVADTFSSSGWKASVKYMYYEPIGTTDAKNGADVIYSMLKVDTDDTENKDLETWNLMEESDIPVVIVDTFYVTNRTDAGRFGNEDGYKEAAAIYYKALKEAYGFTD